jgi:putative molybdopterin biosynthesis protein
MEDLREFLELKILLNNHVVLDELSAKLLYLIDKTGSILSASRLLGLSYSSAWDMISRIENIIGKKIIERKRGARGGAKLSGYGRKLLDKYIHAYKKYFRKEFSVKIPSAKEYSTIYYYAGSHDIFINHLFGLLSDRGYSTSIEWIGSLKGLSALILGETDLTGIHILDPDTGEYNMPVLRKYASSTRLAMIRGWFRSIGFISRRRLRVEDIINGLLSGELRLINRNEGSGTRQLLEYILENEAQKRDLNIEYIRRIIKGYNNIAYTHIDVAEKISRGEADVGIAIKWVADTYKLYFNHLKWERFDLVTRIDKINTSFIQNLLDIIRSESFIQKIDKSPGYRVTNDLGKIIVF